MLLALVCALCGPASRGTPAEEPACIPRDPLPTAVVWEVREQIVVDRAACLMWTRGDFKTLTGRFANDWDEAMEWARKMNRDAYAGYSDWRVASIAEYRTIRGRLAYEKSFYSDGEFAFWARNEINRWVASYYNFRELYATSGAKQKTSWSREWGFSARLVRVLR